MQEIQHRTTSKLEAGLDYIRQSPRNHGMIKLIVCRPDLQQREVLTEAQLDVEQGLIGDNWRTRGSSRTADGSAHPEMQLNMMNARAIELIAQDSERWQLAGDQLYVDLDLSEQNLPAGTRLMLGTAIIEVTPIPHTGCKKFVSRFGLDAMLFVNSPIGKELHLRGINAKVVQSGIIRVGDEIQKIM